MGIRSTNTDGGYFIYDSVSGLAIGEMWEEGDATDSFIEYWNETQTEDMRSASAELFAQVRHDCVELQLASST